MIAREGWFQRQACRPEIGLGTRSPAARLVAAAGSFALIAALAGCGAGNTATASNDSGALAISGRVMGGDQPIALASISLYAAGTSGARTGATSLLTLPVTTDRNGNFVLTGDYSCPAGAQVYLVSRGGNPGLAGVVSNPAAVLVSALGPCSGLTRNTYIDVTEATTVAAAWSLGQFFGPGQMAGASVTNGVGLANAFAIDAELVNSATGQVPGPALPAGATLESFKINALANALSTCVNSDGTTACNALFAAATANNVRPTNVFDAALNIVGNPGTNVSAVYAVVPSGGPYQPGLVQAPNDWTMSIGHLGSGLNEPSAISIDSQGNAWVANYAGGGVTRFLANGTGQYFVDAGLRESYGIAVDGNDHAWIINEEGNKVNRNTSGSVTEFDASGNEVANSPFANGNIYFPYALAIDTDNTVWIADNGRSGATLLANDGSAPLDPNGFAPTVLTFPISVAIDGSHNAWFASSSSVVELTNTGLATRFACCSSPTALAFDSSGNVWISDFSAQAVEELNGSGATLQTIANVGGLHSPQAVAIDGGNNVWIANYGGRSVSAFAASPTGSASAVLSPAKGLGLDAGMNEPFSITIDASGSVWVASFLTNSAVQFVGLAVPVRTPNRGPAGQP